MNRNDAIIRFIIVRVFWKEKLLREVNSQKLAKELTLAYGFSKKYIYIKKQTFLTEWKKSFLQKKKENGKKKKKTIGAHWNFSRISQKFRFKYKADSTYFS